MSFIVNTTDLIPFAATKLTFFSCGYAIEHYNDALFSAFSLPFPETIVTASRKRQADFLAGRYCASHTLRALLHAPAPVIPINADRSPQWPHGTVGSISHTQGRAVAVAGWHTDFEGVGVDVEPMLSNPVASQIHAYVVTKAEKHRFSTVPDALLVSLLFSAKESLYKAVYHLVHRVLDFQEAEITSIDWTHGLFGIRLTGSHCQRRLCNMTLHGYFMLSNAIVMTLVVLPTERFAAS